MKKLIRIGIVSFDTSHSVHFTKRINHVGISEDQWVEGAEVVMGYPGGPTIFAGKEVISQRTQEIRDCGVQIIDSPQDMIGKVDAVLIEVQEGRLHLRHAKPFIKAGLPVFVDKPFTCNVSEARKIAELSQTYEVPVFSSSSLRYAVEIQELKAREDLGNILGVDVYSPAAFYPKNPGLFNYGIHGVEMLYSLMGSGCSTVICTWDERWEKVVGHWKDGRIGCFRGIREGGDEYGFTVFGEKKIVTSAVNTQYIYRELLKRIIEMFETRKPPILIEETIESVSFIEASLKSANEGGTKQHLKN
jgi:predicted dehydrogenase